MGMQYRLTLSTAQASAADKAIELLLRLKIGQFDVLPENLMALGSDGYCEHRDAAKPYLYGLERVFSTYYHKDDEWHRLYDLHQVIRKAIHDAEHPETTGVDSYPLMCTSGEKMARMEATVATDTNVLGKWISVEDRLPEEQINPITNDYKKVLCVCDFGGIPRRIDVRTFGYGRIGMNGEPHFLHALQNMDGVVTHWMPLPEPPDEENDGK